MRNTYNTHTIVPDNINITNLLPQANTLNYSIDDSATNIGNNNDGISLPMNITGLPGLHCITSRSAVETRYTCKNDINLIKGHQYYLRWSTIATDTMRFDCYWPLKEPSVADYRTATQKLIVFVNGGIKSDFTTVDKMPQIMENYFQINTEVFSRNDSNTGTYEFRFDFDNNYIACNVNFSCPMLIDLTATYTNNGLTIPGIQELNTKEYFEGTIKLINW